MPHLRRNSSKVIFVNIFFLVCIVSFAGCIGSLRENLFFLKFYSFCLLIFFLLEMVLLALAFIYPHKLTGSKWVIEREGQDIGL